MCSNGNKNRFEIFFTVFIMIPFVQLIFTALVVSISYFVYRYVSRFKRARKCLSWVPHVPRKPIIGSVMEVGSPVDFLENLTRLTSNPEKTCYIEDPVHWHLYTRNHDFAQWLLSSTTVLDRANAYRYFSDWLREGLLTASGSKWKSRRRVITPAFHFSILEQFVEVFDAHSSVLVEKLAAVAKTGEVVDLYDYIPFCTLDAICETAMGVKMDTQHGKNNDFVQAAKDYCRIAVSRVLSLWRGIDILFGYSKEAKDMKRDVQILHDFSDAVIEKRRLNPVNIAEDGSATDETGRKRKLAFLDLLMAAKVDGKPLSHEDIMEEVHTFIFEGQDTTATSISFVCFMLMRHPRVQNLVVEEQKRIFGGDKDRATTFQDLNEMKYLDLVIKETLRFFSPISLVGRCAGEDVTYKGNIIPKETMMFVIIWAMNRDPEVFESPEEFKPERFSDINLKSPYYYIPFSAGPRNCIGQKYAIVELKCIISKIVRNYQLLPTDSPHDMKLAFETIMRATNGVKMKLNSRSWEQV